MDEKIQLRGWLAASRNLKITCLGEYMDLGVCVQYRNLLNKFPADRIFISDTEQVCFLDGYVYNREDFIRPEGYHEWPDSFAFSLREDRKKHLSKLRGAFCGYHYEKETDRITVYTDQVSNKAVYYYCEKDGWILSDHLEYMVRVLRENSIAYDFDERAAQYMLTCGYMLDDSTFVTQIRRLLPGYYAEITGGSVSLYRYYELPCGREEMSEDEAVERIDSAFRQAVDREFAKDREYGYRHLVDLSGGLDSRMVTWIAHDLGYTEQLNVAYGRLGYLDQTISEQVAAALKHEYLHKPLDDLTWMYDVDEMTLKNNGAAICLGMTGGNRLLQALNTERFGIEHTGMVGDAILSTFYHDRALNDRAPAFGLHQYSGRLQYDFDETILSDYRNQESFALMTRGILGAQSSYLIRHHYVETGSAFLDVDFLEAVMTIPFEYRKGHHIYLKWIAKKYPQAAEFVWEKWGVKPKESQIFKRKVRTTGKLAEGCLRKVTHQPERVSMNPTDYWYKNDANVRKYFEAMFGQRIGSRLLSNRLRDDVKQLFIEGNFSEKTQALTVLSGLHQFLERDDRMSKNVQEVDFLIIYEHKVRELENMCLIKYELEKRGYKVLIKHIEDEEALEAVKPIYHAKVVMTMACYQNASLEWHTKDFVSFDKVIDMQWENIVYPKDERAGVFKNYTGIGREVVRVSWGEANRRRLLEAAHMDPRNVKVVGHIGMDFLRDELKGYYQDRETLFAEYGLPTDKKVLLFASPFYADNLSEDYIAGMCKKHGDDWRDYYDFMMRSEKIILEWMERLCGERNDIIVIYRPHPGHIGVHMSEVAKRHDNFKVISDKSVKQWIIASDIVYTGNSSTIVEAYFAGRMCHLLFPLAVTDGFELKLVSQGRKITDYEAFARTVDEKDPVFPIDKSAINEIYLVDEKEPSYKKLADMAEEVYKDPSYDLTKEQLASYRTKQPPLIRMQKKLQQWDWFYDKYKDILANEHIHWHWIEGQRALRREKMERNKRFAIESTNEEEIRSIIQRIAAQLDKTSK